MTKKPEDDSYDRAVHVPDEWGVVGELFTVRLQRAEYLLSRATTKAWTNYKLRTGAIGVLSQIVKYPGISQNEIVKRTTFDKSAVTLIVNNLERLGWAERHTSTTDRRRQSLRATPVGERELARIIERLKAIESRMLAAISPAILEQLSNLLDQVSASCLAAESD
jgi:DNA-binding MarR family transcriptional regulator